MTSLMYAAAYGYPLTASYLCNYNANISLKNMYETNAIMIAAYYGDIEILQVFYDFYSNLNSIKYFNFTPLMIASQEGKLEAVKFLIENGANINKTNIENLTALDIAVYNNKKNIAEYLIKLGAENRKISENLTTYEITQINKNEEISQLFKINIKKRHKKKIFSDFIFKKKLNFAIKDIPSEYSNK